MALDLATAARELHPELLWLLPPAGLAVGLLYHALGRDVAAGTTLILDQVHEPRATVPLRMAPLVFVGTVVTHLCGGSAGREGTAVQMGGALADQVARFVPRADRRALLRAGLSAGFGSVFGVPWAGAVFGLEVLRSRGRPSAALGCVIASFVGHLVALRWGARHVGYPVPPPFVLSLGSLGRLGVAGVAFGLGARMFTILAHAVQRAFARAIAYPPLRPLVGGGVVLAGFHLVGGVRYAGLGVPVIVQSLTQTAPFADSVLKLVFTALTLGSGFKGGEVTPLLFVGATLGSWLASALAQPGLAALGLVAVFAGAARTPLTGAVMAIELFGRDVGWPALVACVVSVITAGPDGIYARRR